jgi:glutathione S-transferase
MAYEIFTVSGSPRGWRVMLGCLIKGLAFEPRFVSVDTGELKSPEFAKLNPRQRVPVLKDGDFVLTESIAILAYLDRKHPAPSLTGGDPEAAGKIWRIAMEGVHDLRDASAAVIRPIFTADADPADPELRAAADRLHSEHERLERALAEGTALVGSTLGLADCVCFPEVRFLLRAIERFPMKFESLGFEPYAQRYPRIAQWVKRIESLPGYERTFPAHWRTAA